MKRSRILVTYLWAYLKHIFSDDDPNDSWLPIEYLSVIRPLVLGGVGEQNYMHHKHLHNLARACLVDQALESGIRGWSVHHGGSRHLNMKPNYSTNRGMAACDCFSICSSPNLASTPAALHMEGEGFGGELVVG